MKRKRVTKQVETWELDTGEPGLRPRNATTVDEQVILATEVVTHSTASKEVGSETWHPMVLMEITGRFNRTDRQTTIVVALDAAAVGSIAEGLVVAAKRANVDAAVGVIGEDRP